MSRFEKAFRLALDATRIPDETLVGLHWQLVIRDPHLSPDDPWRLGVIIAEREVAIALLGSLQDAGDPTERFDVAIAWLLLAAHAADQDANIAAVASERLADLIEHRFERTQPPGVRPQRLRRAAQWWRRQAGKGGVDLEPCREPALACA